MSLTDHDAWCRVKDLLVARQEALARGEDTQYVGICDALAVLRWEKGEIDKDQRMRMENVLDTNFKPHDFDDAGDLYYWPTRDVASRIDAVDVILRITEPEHLHAT